MRPRRRLSTPKDTARSMHSNIPTFVCALWSTQHRPPCVQWRAPRHHAVGGLVTAKASEAKAQWGWARSIASASLVVGRLAKACRLVTSLPLLVCAQAQPPCVLILIRALLGCCRLERHNQTNLIRIDPSPSQQARTLLLLARTEQVRATRRPPPPGRQLLASCPSRHPVDRHPSPSSSSHGIVRRVQRYVSARAWGVWGRIHGSRRSALHASDQLASPLPRGRTTHPQATDSPLTNSPTDHNPNPKRRRGRGVRADALPGAHGARLQDPAPRHLGRLPRGRLEGRGACMSVCEWAAIFDRGARVGWC